MKWLISLLLAGGFAVGCAVTPASQDDMGYQHDPQYSQYPAAPPNPAYVQYAQNTPNSQRQYAPYAQNPASSPLAMDQQYEAQATGGAQPTTNPSMTIANAADVSGELTAIKSAANAEAAMEAYSRAMAINPSDRELQNVYIRKMVDLNLPDEATAAAQRLLAVAPDHSLARGVVAYDQARHGDLPDAVQNIVLAAQKAPTDPFIAKQAASILAWYDLTPHQPPVSQTIKDALPAVRKTLEAQSVYTDAYKQAAQFYKQAQAVAATQPAMANNAPAAPPLYPSQEQPVNSGYLGQQPMESGPYGAGAAPYTDYYPDTATYYYPDSYYPAYYAGYPYDYGFCGWGWGCGPFFCGADLLFCDRFYGHNFYGHHAWDGGRGLRGSRGGIGGGSRGFSGTAGVARPGYNSSSYGRSGYVPSYNTRSYASPGRTYSSGSGHYNYSGGRSSYGGGRSYGGGGGFHGGGGGGHGGGGHR